LVRAIVVEQLGGPEVLRLAERPAPRPGSGQLLVKVAAAGINFMDIYQRQGSAYKTAPPFVPGTEGAGTVVDVGPDVTGFAKGDRVVWTGVAGSYAEQVLVPAERAVAVPEGVDLRTAAAAMLQGMTAHYLSHSTYPVARQDVTVVHAAAGGVGLLLTQMVKMRGGTVIATTSTSAKAELAREAGADRVAGYEDFVGVVRQVTNGKGAAVVYDGVGRATFDQSLTALRRRGHMVLYGASSGAVPPVDPQRLAAGGSLYLTRPVVGDYTASRDELLWRATDVFTWIKQGKLTIRVGATYPLDQASRAHEDLGTRRTTGKLLLLPD
jgi:NADPH:quinone reductase